MQSITVLGDLHYELADRETFLAARRQMIDLAADAVFQLGDLGGYSHCGSWQSFEEGLDFLAGFDRPFYTLMGNHDLEGAEYATDEQSVAAWCQAFGYQRPYQMVELGSAIAICLSATSCRSNPASHHEVRLGAEQLRWLRQTLQAHRSRPTFVFAHVPVIGSGLRVLQNIHLRCPNAWMNHTDRPEQIFQLIQDFPQVKLWFSAHNHLGQQYADSITRVGHCTFVHTGVIGPVSRDGCCQSRFVEFDDNGFALSTIDHRLGSCTLDWRHQYDAAKFERISPPKKPVDDVHFTPSPMPKHAGRLEIGRSVFAVWRDMLVEYDRELAAPIGVVCDLGGHERIEVRGRILELYSRDGTMRAVPPRPDGRFFDVYAPNPHRPATKFPEQSRKSA